MDVRGLSQGPLVLGALLCAAVQLSTIAPAADRTPLEQAGLRRIAQVWVKLADWALAQALGDEARFAAAQALNADSSLDGVQELQTKAANLSNAANEKDKKTWDEKLKSAKKQAAKLYEELFLAGEREAEPAARARYEDYTIAAIDLEASAERWGRLLGTAEKRLADGKRGEAARLADRLLTREPPGKAAPRLIHVIESAAAAQPVLRTASRHPMRYYLQLPADYKRARGRKWPILVCVDGAGSNFEGMAQGYKGARGDLPLIIVSPCSFSNTNQIAGNEDQMKKYRQFYTDEVIAVADRERIDWDESGVMQIIDDLKAQFDAEERIYITGFSGGGNLCYALIFKHPALVMAAAPACANFGHPDYAAALADKSTVEERRFAVQLFTGEKDPHREWTFGQVGNPGIEQQTDWAMEVFKALSYPVVKRTMLAGVDHSSCAQQVLEFFRPYLLGKKQRGDLP